MKQKLNRHYLVLLLVLFLFSGTFAYSYTDKAWQILILHSYSTDYQWTNSTNETLHQALYEKAP